MSKRCTRCHQWKDDRDFYRDKSKLDGLKSHCKACHEAYKREYRARPGALMQRRRLSYLRRQPFYVQPSIHNSPEFRAWLAHNRARRQAHIRHFLRRWYSHDRAASRAHHEDAPEAIRISRQQYRARIVSAPANTLTSTEWQWLLEKYGFRCAYCGQPGQGLTPDHVIPLSRGGNNTLSNIVPSCSPCNLRKGARTPEEAGMAFAVRVNTTGNLEQLALI